MDIEKFIKVFVIRKFINDLLSLFMVIKCLIVMVNLMVRGVEFFRFVCFLLMDVRIVKIRINVIIIFILNFWVFVMFLFILLMFSLFWVVVGVRLNSIVVFMMVLISWDIMYIRVWIMFICFVIRVVRVMVGLM